MLTLRAQATAQCLQMTKISIRTSWRQKMQRRSTILIQVTLAATRVQERRRVKAEKREQKAARKKTSAPRKERGEGKAKKKTKLPGQPKRPMSAYFLWLNSEGRDKIKEENPGFGVTEVSKKAGEMR